MLAQYLFRQLEEDGYALYFCTSKASTSKASKLSTLAEYLFRQLAEDGYALLIR